MKTRILDANTPGAVATASQLLGQGELVAFPTETVYGLGANGLEPLAVEKIFAAKGRPGDNPLILHVSSLEQALPLWRASQQQLQVARRLAGAFWPGPLSLVLPASSRVPSQVTAGLDSVAIRAPANPVARALLRTCPFPLAAPSANLSGRPSPTRAGHVATTLNGTIAAILDGGPTLHGIESTVVDIREERPRILRFGSLPQSALETLAGQVSAVACGTDPSPGLRHRHYQPQGVTLHLADSAAIAAAWPGPTAILCRVATGSRLGPRHGPLLLLPDDPGDCAAELYNTLYSLEDYGVQSCLVEQVPDTRDWQAIRERLLRATTP